MTAQNTLRIVRTWSLHLELTGNAKRINWDNEKLYNHESYCTYRDCQYLLDAGFGTPLEMSEVYRVVSVWVHPICLMLFTQM